MLRKTREKAGQPVDGDRGASMTRMNRIGSHPAVAGAVIGTGLAMLMHGTAYSPNGMVATAGIAIMGLGIAISAWSLHEMIRRQIETR